MKELSNIRVTELENYTVTRRKGVNTLTIPSAMNSDKKMIDAICRELIIQGVVKTRVTQTSKYIVEVQHRTAKKNKDIILNAWDDFDLYSTVKEIPRKKGIEIIVRINTHKEK